MQQFFRLTFHQHAWAGVRELNRNDQSLESRAPQAIATLWKFVSRLHRLQACPLLSFASYKHSMVLPAWWSIHLLISFLFLFLVALIYVSRIQSRNAGGDDENKQNSTDCLTIDKQCLMDHKQACASCATWRTVFCMETCKSHNITKKLLHNLQ